MASPSGSPRLSKNNSCSDLLRIGRRGRKLQHVDDQRLLNVLPKDVPERTWLEALQKEEQDLFFFELREEIVDRALDVCYEAYMERQTVSFTVHCAAEAWLKLIDWHFLRHDPGEDASAHPPCDIPNRAESWVPDVMPVPSPKDTYAYDALVVKEGTAGELKRHGSHDSLEYPNLTPITPEYWFPGKVEIAKEQSQETKIEEDTQCSGTASVSTMVIASEMLEKVTEYNKDIVSPQVSKADIGTELSRSFPRVDGGDGDAALPKRPLPKKVGSKKEKKVDVVKSRSKISLAPLKLGRGQSQLTHSAASIPSDLRPRNLRLDTAYEVSSEKITLLEDKKPKKK